MKPIAPPRRPETLHLALRYERLAREGRIEAASPYDPRIHASIDLGVEEEVALMARRYLNGFRGAGARQVAVMVAERPFQHALSRRWAPRALAARAPAPSTSRG